MNNMLNKEKHQLIMGRILKDLYSETSIAPLFGFKGDTCAHLFYELPRFSVDLDFDLLASGAGKKNIIFDTVKKILVAHGKVKDSYIKRHTIFFLLSYGDTDHNIKFEVNTRFDIPNVNERYELKEHLGISMLVATPPYLFAGKLTALTLRHQTAMRDIYDVWYFAKNNWDIDTEVVKIRTGKKVGEQLADCVTIIEQIADNEILQGLGELLSDKEKAWVKTHLRKETIFLLKNYLSALK